MDIRAAPPPIVEWHGAGPLVKKQPGQGAGLPPLPRVCYDDQRSPFEAVHELQATQSILDAVLEAARASGLRRVYRVRLVIGELNELQQRWIQRYFDHLSEGSAAEDAEILVETIPPAFGCRDCGQEFGVRMSAVDTVRCPGCGGGNLALTRGREFLIRDMEGQ